MRGFVAAPLMPLARPVAFALLATCTAASAQSEWRERPVGASVSYDAAAPVERATVGRIGPIGPSYSYTSTRLLSAHLLSARVPVWERVTLFAEVPVTYRDYDLSAEEDARLEQIAQSGSGLDIVLSQRHSAIGLGNPMLGAEVAVSERATIDMSLRLPVGGRRAGGLATTALNAPDLVGEATDPLRPEAYATGVASLSAGVRHRRPLGYFALEGGFKGVFSVLDGEIARAPDPRGAFNSGATTNLAFLWGGAVRAHAGPVDLGLGLTGRIDPRAGWTRERPDPVQASASVGLGVGPVRPTIQVQNGRTARDGMVLGFSLDVPLR